MLAAGAGTRLRPLSDLLPKALCPLGDRPLVDHAIEGLLGVTDAVALNVHHHADALIAHTDALTRRIYPLGDRRIHISREEPVALGTAGAVGGIVDWLGGRHVLVTNADTFHDAELTEFVKRWDVRRVAVLTGTPGDFGPRSTVVASIIPAAVAAGIPPEPAGLWERLWRHESAAGRMQVVHEPIEVIDCGTPAGYLAANLRWAEAGTGSAASGGWVHPRAEVSGEVVASVVGRGASVAGRITRCVVWPDSRVGASEVLRDAVRAGPLTVEVADRR